MSKAISFHFMRLQPHVLALLVYTAASDLLQSIAPEVLAEDLHTELPFMPSYLPQSVEFGPEWIHNLDLKSDDMPEVVRNLLIEDSPPDESLRNRLVRLVQEGPPEHSAGNHTDPSNPSVPVASVTHDEPSTAAPSLGPVAVDVDDGHMWLVVGFAALVGAVVFALIRLAAVQRQEKTTTHTFKTSSDTSSFSSSDTTPETSSDAPARLNSYSRIRSLLANRPKSKAKANSSPVSGSASPGFQSAVSSRDVTGKDGGSTMSADTEEDMAEVYDRVTASLRTLSLISKQNVGTKSQSQGSQQGSTESTPRNQKFPLAADRA